MRERAGFSHYLAITVDTYRRMSAAASAGKSEVMEKTKQATYQPDTITNKVHYSLSSPRDQHSPPWLKLLNAQLAKVLHNIGVLGEAFLSWLRLLASF